MLNKLLSLLPPVAVRHIAETSYVNLRERGHISTWLVAWNKDSSLVGDGDSGDSDDDDDDADFDSLFDFDINSLGVEDGECDPDAVPSLSSGVEADYIKRHISRIPQYGDNSRWRLADYLDMFDNLSRDGSLTNEQREAVDNFVAAYQSNAKEF